MVVTELFLKLMLKLWDDGRSLKNSSNQGHKVLD